MAYFYFSNDQIDEAISFLRRKSPGKAEGFLKLAEYAFENSKLTFIPRLNYEIKKIGRSVNNQHYLAQAMLIDMKYYRQIKDYKRHLSISRTVKMKIIDGKATKKFRENAIGEIREFLTLIQLKRIYSGKESSFKRLPEIKLNIAYYEILSAIDPKNKFEYFFVEGELHFRVEQYELAAKRYITAARIIEKQKIKTKLYRKILDSLAATYKRKENKEVFKFIFSRFLRKYPKSDTTKKLLPLKFVQSLEAKKYKTAEVVVLRYYKTFKKEKKIAQGMLARLIDVYISQENLGKIKAWSRKLDSGYMGFTATYKTKIRGTIGGLELNNAIAMTKKSPNKAEALYIRLYRDTTLDRDVRGQASLSLADINIRKFNLIGSYNWTINSLEVLSKKDNLKFSSQYFALAEKLALHQKVNESLNVYQKFLVQHCSSNFNEKEQFLKNYLHYSILEQRGLRKTVRLVEKCSSESKSDKWRELALYHIFEYDLYSTYGSQFRSIVRSFDFYKKVYRRISKVYWQTGNESLLQSMKKMSSSLHFRLLSHSDKLELTVIRDVKKYKKEVERYQFFSLIKKNMVTEKKS